jgi:hypothetical protein
MPPPTSVTLVLFAARARAAEAFGSVVLKS